MHLENQSKAAIPATRSALLALLGVIQRVLENFNMTYNFGKLFAGFAAAVTLMSSAAFAAPITDVQEYNNNSATEYFVDSDANKYSQPTFWRDKNQDWEWIHNPLAGLFSSIKLSISAFDVDFAQGELDAISVFDGSSWLSLGNLAGGNDIWAFTDFDLGAFSWAQSQVNAGLKVRMNIDLNNTGWLVTLGKSTLTVNGGDLACVPTPGVPCTSIDVAEPGIFGLFGLAFAGLMLRRRKANKA